MVLGDGEHHNATNTTWDFLGNRDRIRSLRLYPHAEADKKAANGEPYRPLKKLNQASRAMRRERLL